MKLLKSNILYWLLVFFYIYALVDKINNFGAFIVNLGKYTGFTSFQVTLVGYFAISLFAIVILSMILFKEKTFPYLLSVLLLFLFLGYNLFLNSISNDYCGCSYIITGLNKNTNFFMLTLFILLSVGFTISKKKQRYNV